MGRAMYRRMAAIYAREGWTWANRNGQQVDPYVPTVDDIARTVARLASHLDNGDTATTGRILVVAPSEEEAGMPGAKVKVLVQMGYLE